MYESFDLTRPVYTLSVGEFIELNKQILSEMLQGLKQTPDVKGEEELLDIKQTAKLLNIAVATIYGLTSRRLIPYFKMPGQKRLYFKRSKLMEWLEEGRRKTIKEINDEADIYLSNRRRKR